MHKCPKKFATWWTCKIQATDLQRNKITTTAAFKPSLHYKAPYCCSHYDFLLSVILIFIWEQMTFADFFIFQIWSKKTTKKTDMHMWSRFVGRSKGLKPIFRLDMQWGEFWENSSGSLNASCFFVCLVNSVMWQPPQRRAVLSNRQHERE